MLSMHRQYGPQLTYRMHRLVSSGTESASSFPSSTQKRVGLWCQSWVATWVEATWHVQACWQTSWSSPLASERWELRKVWYNASIYHRTWHRPLHAMLVFGGIYKNTDLTGSLPSLRRGCTNKNKKWRTPFPPTYRWGKRPAHQRRWVTNSSQVADRYVPRKQYCK